MSTLAAAHPSRPKAVEKPTWDVWLLGAVLLLTALGVVMVYSSSAAFAGTKLGDGAFYLKRQGLFALFGVGILAVVMRIGYQRLEKLTYPLLGLSAILVIATLIPGIGVKAGGAWRWIDLGVGGLRFQPSELAKIALCLYLAKSAAQKGASIEDFKIGFLPPMVVAGIMGALVLVQPDFGSAAVMIALTLVVLVVAGARMYYMAIFGFVLSLVAVPLVLLSPYRLARVMTMFTDPFDESVRYGAAYHVANSLMSIGSGGLTGLGLGNGRQKLGFLPEGHTDYILASIGEELGLVGIALVVLLFAIIIARGTRAALVACDPFGAYLAVALTSLLAIETLINIGMVMAILPPKGIALPFLSYGGTSMMKCMIVAGLLLSISTGGGGFLKNARGAIPCR